MDQSVMNFATVAARSSAIPTPTTGMVSYVGDTGSDSATNATIVDVPQIQAYTGSAWQNVDGLTLVAKATIGTAVTSVTVTNAFSATYENYKIIVSGGASTSGVNVAMTLGASATQYYATLGNISYATAIFGAFALNNGAAWPYVGYVDANGWRIGLDLYSPFLAKSTTFNGYYTALASSSGAVLGIHNEQTSYTDFTISIAAATATGGTIYVYGYRKS
jgi:hypothetical protein